MHHRWRGRAADRAELDPGAAALDVCCGTGDLALELAARVGPQGQWSAATSPRRCSSSPARKAAERSLSQVSFEWADALELPVSGRGFRRGHGRLRGAQPGRPGPRPRGAGAGAEAGRPAGDPRDHPAAAPPALASSTRCGSTGSSRSWARSPATAMHTPICPESVKRFPSPAGLGRDDGRGWGSSGSGTWCWPAGSSPSIQAPSRLSRSHPGRCSRWTRSETPREPLRRPAAGDRWCSTPRTRGCRPAWRPSRSGCGDLLEGHGETLAADAGSTLEAGGKRLRPMLVLLSAGPARRARRRSAPRPRSSSSTWRPSSTTTCSTRRRFGAAARPWWRAPAAIARWRSATCCSRAPSPSSAADGDRAAGRAAVRRVGGPRPR